MKYSAQFKLLLLSGCFAVTSLPAYADDVLNSKRKIFVQAEKALKKNQISKFLKLNEQLDDYPLQSYLEYLYLSRRLGHTDSDTISKFLLDSQHDFYTDKLLNSWLHYLAKKKKWILFLQHYRPNIRSAAMQCLRLRALIAVGSLEQAFADASSLWLVPYSQNSACNPVFALWRKKGLLTDDLRWQRIKLALQANRFSFARYLARPLKDTKIANAWIDRWQTIHRNPLFLLRQLPIKNYTSKRVSLALDIPISRSIIAHGIARLASKSTEKAFAAWQRIQPAYHFSEQEKHTIQRSIAVYAALGRKQRTLEFFGDIKDEPWRVRAALWRQDWMAVQTAIASLNDEDQSSSRWMYWLARSETQLGNQQRANHLYQSVAVERNFYGFLAADRLQQSYHMGHNPINFTQTELDTLAKLPTVARLREFYALNRRLDARRQAYKLHATLSAEDLKLLAVLAHKWGWHSQTIAMLGKAKYWDALDLRFPMPHDDAILKAAKRHGLNPSWLFAVARQESTFDPYARSSAGATGLMQLMPKTSRFVAKLIKKPLRKSTELLNPSRNIELGSAYLRHMYDQNQRNAVLATAAYNAGPHRIVGWLPKKKLSADIWIENIPFQETRDYTQSVLSYAVIFDYRRKRKIVSLSKRMPVVKPK